MNSSQRGYLFGVAAGFMFLVGAATGAIVLLWLRSLGTTIGVGSWAILALLAAPLVGLGHWLRNRFQYVLEDAERLAEETRLVLAGDSIRKVSTPSEEALAKVAGSVNELAETLGELRAQRREEIERAREDVAQERNRLAALMSELASAVLVCDLEGRILLFNRSARRLLEGDGPDAGFVGLDRSVYGVIEQPSLQHALASLRYRLEQIRRQDRQESVRQAELVVSFLISAQRGRLLRVRLAPILDAGSEMTGFVLSLLDMTENFAASERRDRLLESLVQGLRSKLANVRAAIETLEGFPAMVVARQLQLRGVIAEETEALAELLETTMELHGRDLKSAWQLEEMAGADLLWAVRRHFEDQHDFVLEAEGEGEEIWLRVDSYALVRGLAQVVEGLRREFGVEAAQLRLRPEKSFAAFDLVWSYDRIDVDALCDWQRRNTEVSELEGAPSLQEVARRHGGEAWFNLERDARRAYFRLLLPVVESGPPLRPGGPTRLDTEDGAPPENYDFDLLDRAGARPELDRRPLDELAMTVFDTETTGTDIAGGDRILSIGAVRIVNGRLLGEEIFDQLVDPRREIPEASTRIHGLVAEDVAGMPPIEGVLPRFARFCEDTVLVAHNASFDLKALQVAEEASGVRFDHPVLDTLLLSRIADPEEDDHRLEAIAERLGVEVTGRHTALGDSIMTARCLLRLLPLLRARRILTLQDARKATRETLWSRVR